MLVARDNGQVGKDDISTILALITGLVMTTMPLITWNVYQPVLPLMTGLISYHAYYLSHCFLASFFGVFDCLCTPHRARRGSWEGERTLLINSIKYNYGVSELGLAAIRPEPSPGSPSAEIAPYRAHYNQSPTFVYYILSSNSLFFGCLPTHLGFKIVKFLKVSASNRSSHLL